MTRKVVTLRKVLSLLAGALAAIGAPVDAAAQSAGPAPGQADGDTRAVAEMLFFTARGLMEAGRYTQACEKFAESYRLDPAAGTLLNLAVCHEKEGRIASAWGEYRQSMADARKANRPDREELARSAIARIEPELPFLTISVPQGVRVAGLKIERNGIPLNDAAWDTELPIDPGNNEISATAPRYKAQTKTVVIERKQHLVVAIDPMELKSRERPPQSFWTGQRQLGATLLAGGVAAAGVGAFFGVLALDNRAKSDDNCPVFDGERRCTTAGANAMSSAKTDAWAADVAIGAGAAAIAAGAVLLLTSHGPAEGAPGGEGRAAWSWGLNGGPAGAHGFLVHSF